MKSNRNKAIAKVKWDSEKKNFDAQRIARKRMESQARGQPSNQSLMNAMSMDDRSILFKDLFLVLWTKW